jgi:hypothetical protein
MPALTRTAPREHDRIREVFLSATARDVAEYRTSVRDALELLNTAVFLQEAWAVPAAGVLAICLGRLHDSDAYIGVFGYRYGWIPEGESRSITELECAEALRRWGGAVVPPVFLFMPEPGSAAARQLEEAAARVLAEDHPGDETKQALSRQRQREFCDRLRDSGRFIGPFATLGDLRARAIASVANWNMEILAHAAERRAPAIAEIPPSELGAIDRGPQREALENALFGVRNSGAPGLCAIVHGGEDAGQFAFLSFLESWPDWEISAPPRLITPPHDRFDATSLLAAALAEIAPGTAAAAAVGDLADAVVRRSRDESLVMFVSLDRLDGGVEAFHAAVWSPLLAEVAARRGNNRAGHPFVIVATLSAPLPAPLPPGISAAIDSGDPDYTRLLALPELQPFTSSDVAEWLKSLGLPLDRRKQIAHRVTKDGVPRAVFDRLNTDGFYRTLER